MKLRVSLVHCFDDYIEFRLSCSAWMKMIDCGILAPVIKALTVHKSFMPSKLAPAKRKCTHMRHNRSRYCYETSYFNINNITKVRQCNPLYTPWQ